MIIRALCQYDKRLTYSQEKKKNKPLLRSLRRKRRVLISAINGLAGHLLRKWSSFPLAVEAAG